MLRCRGAGKAGDPQCGRGHEDFIRSTVAAGATQWLQQVAAVERRGELLSVVDLAERGPGRTSQRRRPGSTGPCSHALAPPARGRRFETYGLGSLDDEDAQALAPTSRNRHIANIHMLMPESAPGW
jgi:hypothetical protein